MKQGKCSKKPPSVRALARQLGVSPMTVSRALSGKAPVDEKTRKAVLAAALQLGYQAGNFPSRGLSNSVDVPLVLWCGRSLLEREHESDTHYFSQLHFRACAALEQAGARCHLVESSDEKPRELLEARVICSHRLEDLRGLARPGRSSTLVGLDLDNPWGPCVRMDVEQTAELAAARLEAFGHRHVAVFSSNEGSTQEERVGAFCRRFGSIKGQRVDLVAARATGPGGAHVLDHYLASSAALPTALYTTGGYFTLSAWQRLTARGLNVPANLGLLGFDNFAFYRHLSLSIDRVHADLALMGDLVADLLRRALAEGPLTAAVKTLVPARLIEGGSLLPVSEMRPVKR